MIFQRKAICRKCGAENNVINDKIVIKNQSFIFLTLNCWRCSNYTQLAVEELELLTNSKKYRL